MNIIACIKVVPDERDILIKDDGELSFERAKPILSAYDLNAVEAGVRLIEANGGSLTALSVGGESIDDSKLKKNILSRGPDRLVMVADKELKDLDTHQTARVLKAAIEKIGPYDLILCGEGSADIYAQQVGIQLGQLLDLPTCNGVSGISVDQGRLLVERSLEEEVETLEVALPALISVTSDINLPRIVGMKEILEAGKKPGTIWKSRDIEVSEIERTVDVLETRAPKKVERKQDIIEGDSDDQIKSFVARILEVLR